METIKILAISDFHGKFPRIKKDDSDFDVVMTAGDFCRSEKIRTAIFKHWDDRQIWFELVGKRKALKMFFEGVKTGENVIKQLSKLAGKRKIYGIPGNFDFRPRKNLNWKVYEKDFYAKYTSSAKNYKDINMKKARFHGLDIIGYGEQSFPEKKVSAEHFSKKYSALKRLFTASKDPHKTILLCHNPPYGTFDKVLFKESPEYGNHLGSQVAAEIIKRFQPLLVICGHMHEHQGVARKGRTTIVNCGQAEKGNYAVILLKDGKCSVKLRKRRKT